MDLPSQLETHTVGKAGDETTHAVAVADGASANCQNTTFYREKNYEPDDSVGYMMRRIISLVGHGIEAELESTGLTNAQWVPLFRLYKGDASTVAELARICDIDAGSMTRLLDRLEAKGLCRRVRSCDDRRVVHIELTDAGRVSAQEIPKTLCRIQNAHLQGFSMDEWQSLKGFLRRILHTAQDLHALRTGEKLPEKALAAAADSVTTAVKVDGSHSGSAPEPSHS